MVLPEENPPKKATIEWLIRTNSSQIILYDEVDGEVKIYQPVKTTSPWKGAQAYYSVTCIGALPWTQQSMNFYGTHLKHYRGLGISLAIPTDIEEDGFFVDVYQKDSFVLPSWKNHDQTAFLLKDRLMKRAPTTLRFLLMAMMPDLDLPMIQSEEAELQRENFHGYFEELKEGRRIAPQYELQMQDLTATLRPYQEEAVRFMIHKELHPQLKATTEFSSIEVQEGIYYFPYCGLFAKQRWDIELSLQGGILAEEMGLGKTVELLALISTRNPNNPDPDIIKKNHVKRRREDPIVETVEYLVSSVTASIEGDMGIKEMDKIRAKTVKGALYYNTQLPNKRKNFWLTCVSCYERCCSDRITLPANYDTTNFKCPTCMIDETVDAGATLIVVPNSILSQWYEEIRRHIRENVTVDLYQGVFVHGYKHPELLAGQDIVLTTYDVLEKELYLVDWKPREGLRKRARAQVSPSPLLSINWWRICLDESQMVEGGTRRAALMCHKLRSRARWCVTGTPLQRSLSDIGGLLSFLGIFPFNVPEIWSKLHWVQYTHGDKDFLLNFIRQFFWRNNKQDVIDQLNLPPRNANLTTLDFAPLEERTYQIGLEVTKQALSRDLRTSTIEENPETLLKNLNQKLFTKIWSRLCYLRASIVTATGEGLGLGALLGNKRENADVFSPNVLFARLHLRGRRHLMEKNRTLMANRHGLAGLHFLFGNLDEAFEVYKEAWDILLDTKRINEKLGLASNSIEDLFTAEELDPKGKPITVDSTQVIHCGKALKALAEVHEGARRFFEEQTIGDYLAGAAGRFLGQSLGAIHLASADIIKAIEKYNDGQSRLPENEKFSWLAKALNLVMSDENHEIAIFDAIDDMRGKESLVKKRANDPAQLRTTNTLHRDFYQTNIYGAVTPLKGDSLRQQILSVVNKASDEIAFICEETVAMVNAALESEKISGNLRQVMECDCYKEFMMTAEERDAMNAERVHRAGREGRRMPRAERSRKNDEERSFIILTDDLDKETLLNTRCASCRIGRRIRDLRELLGGTRDASLQTDSRFSFELLCAHVFRIAIRVPMSQATSTKFNQMYDDFCAWISQIRPLFEASLSAVQAVQELAHKLVELENASKRIEESMEIFVPRAYGGTLEMKTVVNKKKDNRLLQAFRIADQQFTVERQREIALIVYLHAANMGSPGDCPICYNTLENEWMVFPCAHAVCLGCWKHLKKGQKYVQCVTCRSNAIDYKVTKVVSRPNVAINNEQMPGSSKKKLEDLGKQLPKDVSLSVKISAIVLRIYEIIREDPNAKILVFSSMDPVLRALHSAFSQCHIAFVELKTNTKRNSTLKEFKSSHDLKVCLMPLSSGANGLNLTEANHVIFAEPIVETSVEAQAIGRIDRFGQTKPTTVHHFVVQNSIEEEIYRITQNHLFDEGWTVQTLKDVFGIQGIQ
ncbi:unnamed protein product, partial [Mesorhabditis belari]|uniref:E3 ubiquitin-protein ligase SHPRH n=1 Tax=Mesorhabditis belari TaxID=2138241 RepID=A0AAF3EH33_9BILA